jgi:hypothetical protein
MPTPVDEDAIQAFPSGRSSRTVRRRRWPSALGWGVRMTRTSSVRDTSSKGPENFASRSCKRDRF